MNFKGKKFAIAPMMDWTDRHCRVFHRRLTRCALLYTEMITARAILHGNRRKLLDFDPQEQPVALQLGGSEARVLAEAARIGEDWGYGEINLNVGCPSDRVQGGHFGACLMATPDLVAECVAAMRHAVTVPVTVKCRIGIDAQDEEADFQNFIERVSAAGCSTFIVHARKAWLKGLSPRQNREVPPLNYERVYRLKKARPDLTVLLNGGISSVADSVRHLPHVDGVMLGRAAYHMPWELVQVDPLFAGEPSALATRRAVVESMVPYAERYLASGGSLHAISRHMLGLFHGQPGGRLWRQMLSTEGCRRGAGLEVWFRALAGVEAQATRVMEAA